MNTRISTILFIVSSLILSGCSAEQIITPTLTPAPTSTILPTATPVPTQTSTPIPVSLAYSPGPRWMILGQPGYGVEILGEDWNYTNDRWGDTYACIDYTREKEPYLFFEECFAFTQPNLTFESQRNAFLNDGFETLEPSNTFGDVGQISLMAKRQEDNSTKFIKFFEIIGVDKYILLVEMNMATDDTSPLQSIYEKEAADTINYALKNMLEKSHLIPLPTATPLSPTQESFYASLGNKLITELEANTMYEGTWEALGDFVDPKNPMACRDFEDRTNADVLWVSFSDCIILHHPDFNFDGFAEGIKQEPKNVILESSHEYNNQFILYGQFKGHTYFYAYMLDGDYLYFVVLESRTIGEAKVENMFTEEVDDFIYAVMMSNAEK
jgi:hypothetical protein